jgi:hypothetical protein
MNFEINEHDNNKIDTELLDAVKLAYRKHQLGDDSIGWDELSDKLGDALNNAMGPRGFVDWMDGFKREEEAL